MFGRNANGVYSANEYLTRINLMKAYKENADTPIYHAKKVAVVGGGNVAMDAARCKAHGRRGSLHRVSPFREGASGSSREIHHAKEGVVFKFLTAPLEVLSDENFNVTGLKCQQMELGRPDASGRRRPIPVELSDFVLDLDCVIAAIGTSPNPLIRHTTPGLDTNRRAASWLMMSTASPPGRRIRRAATVILAMLPARWTSTVMLMRKKNPRNRKTSGAGKRANTCAPAILDLYKSTSE